MTYKNTKRVELSFEGKTNTDKAFTMWNEMAPLERLEVMNKVHDYKTMSRKFNACINYLAENTV